jgi:hypothetical protein
MAVSLIAEGVHWPGSATGGRPRLNATAAPWLETGRRRHCWRRSRVVPEEHFFVFRTVLLTDGSKSAEPESPQ